jgi:2-dehydropantoate 2-reductase
MKIGIAGTGAVGGYFGGLLRKAGNEVIFFARGKHLNTLKENGLTIESEVEKFNVSGTFTDQYELFSDVDLLLFCVKSTATAQVAEKLRPFLKKECLILTLQNGVDNEEILSTVFGVGRILSAATYIQANVKEPGVVRQMGVFPRLVIGALDSSLKEKVTEISSLLNSANIVTYTSSNIIEMKWKKLIWNVTFNPLTTMIVSPIGAIYDDEGLYHTAKRICKEGIAVARKMGYAIDENYYEEIMAQGQMARNHQTSMLQDKLSSKEIELESICGYLVGKGKQVNVDTPVLETIYRILAFEEKFRKQDGQKVI